MTGAVPAAGPAQADVAALRDLLDLMINFRDNDQRARYLLSSNWMRGRTAVDDRDRDALISTHPLITKGHSETGLRNYSEVVR